MSSSERIFVIGGTGNIGTKAVKDLLDNGVRVTLFARNPDKVKSLFSKIELINIVQGDYNDLSPLKEGLKGHTRLFVVLGESKQFVELKKTIADYAFDAGIQQLVDLSSFSVNLGYRSSESGSEHYYGERAIYDHPERRGHVVMLRPGRFMSNTFWVDRVKSTGKLFDALPPSFGQDWISPNDVGAIAAVILQEDMEKHGDAVYSLVGDVISSQERAAIFSRVLGQEISYQEITPAQKYHTLVEHGLSHQLAFMLSDPLLCAESQRITPAIEILLGRKPETFEQFLEANKQSIQ
ncbi:Prestalk A differentiation protein A [Choanephora cucurbitarum]|uniref:Prestalk A differentiation protein A n=1 Tax=Choanephora cucurbitarum TaxID=101091 RepID=A0A1C7N3N8_9FUNG|nr:Prestalk A differentiation protein A [Choanephora cucurbitarum]